MFCLPSLYTFYIQSYGTHTPTFRLQLLECLSMINSCNSPLLPRTSKTYRNHPYRSVFTSADDSFSEFRPDTETDMSSGKNSYGSLTSCSGFFGKAEASAAPSPMLLARDSPPAPPILALPLSLPNVVPLTVFSVGTPIVVAFKYGVKVMTAPFPVEVGLMLIVEGDRGYDCAKVLHAAHNLQAQAPHQRLPTALRVASPADLEEAVRRAEKEKQALMQLQKLASTTDFTARVVDVMYQLDGKKITIIVERESRIFVDFRRLQRAAFDYFRCRVWFAYLDEVNETMSTDVVKPARRTNPPPVAATQPALHAQRKLVDPNVNLSYAHCGEPMHFHKRPYPVK